MKMPMTRIRRPPNTPPTIAPMFSDEPLPELTAVEVVLVAAEEEEAEVDTNSSGTSNSM